MEPLVRASGAHALPQLAGPFAGIGLVGGALTGTIGLRDGCVPDQGSLVVAFALVTALSAGVLGAYFTHRSRTLGRISTSLIFFGAVTAGVSNGALLMLPIFFPLGSVVGALAGSLFSLPFVPALALVVRWGEMGDASDARKKSIVARACRRGPLAAMAVSIATTSLITFFVQSDETISLSRIAAGIAIGVLLVIVCLDAFARSTARRVATGKAPLLARALPDFGLGADVVVDKSTSAIPYRAITETICICRGDPTVAYGPIHSLLVRHALALVVSLAVCAMQLAR